MLSESETDLICDFAEYYHVLDWRALPLKTAAALAAGLRDESRTVIRISGANVSPAKALAAATLDGINLLVWAKTKDAQKGRNKPKSIFDILTKAQESDDFEKFDSGEQFEEARRRIIKGE